MLIDEFLPVYDFSEYHCIVVDAPIEKVYTVVRTLDLTGARLLRILFWVRSIPARLRGERALGPTLADLQDLGLILLGETPPHELLFGFVGKLWTASGDFEKVDPEAFCRFDRAGFVKGAWNFTLTRSPDGRTLLATETRVGCIGDASRRKFGRYAFFMRPLSGATRWDALRACKRKAENG
jgi:hypothetical protein